MKNLRRLILDNTYCTWIDLAKYCGVSIGTIRNILDVRKETHNPNTVKKICQYYGVNYREYLSPKHLTRHTDRLGTPILRSELHFMATRVDLLEEMSAKQYGEDSEITKSVLTHTTDLYNALGEIDKILKEVEND